MTGRPATRRSVPRRSLPGHMRPGLRPPRRTIRLRLTLWYGGLFLLSGAVLLAVTYALVVQAFKGNPSRGALCAGRTGAAGSHCHVVGAGQQQEAALRAHSAVLQELLSRSGIALAVMALLSVGLGWFIAGRVLRPLRTITAAARAFSAANLGDRLALSGPDDELKELGDTFDELLGRLEGSFRAQRQFIANAAHELRTPLARQRVISQVALANADASTAELRAAHERVLAAGAEQQQLIDALLALALGQAGLDAREPFDLAVLAGQVVDARQAEADGRSLTILATLDAALATGSPGLAARLTANLVDNAMRHNRPGGQVLIATSTQNSRAVLSVANTGPSVPAASLDRLFEPFQRLAASRTARGDGLGLGLSIVRAIAEAHGASILAQPLPEGGLAFEVTFPAVG
jgi:signal transduction histidine kinase